MAILSRAIAAALLVAAACPYASLATAAPARGSALESAVKANYLYKFAPFVEWPPRAFASAASPFKICVIGDDPFGPVLDQAVRRQLVGNRSIVIQRADAAAPDMGCQILFAGRSARQSTVEMLKAVAGEPVLTVTDLSDGVSGGMIQFILREGRVRFTIDSAAAEASGLPISSKLLELALPAER